MEIGDKVEFIYIYELCISYKGGTNSGGNRGHYNNFNVQVLENHGQLFRKLD